MPDAPRRLVLASDLSCVSDASEWLRRLGPEAGLGDEDLYRLDLCAGELLTNIVSYAFEGPEPHAIELSARLRPGEISLQIVDDGRPFDPLAYSIGPSAAMREDAPPGGWGLRLVRRFADDCTYARNDNHNVVSLRVRRRAGAVPGAAQRLTRGSDRRREVHPVPLPLKRSDGTVVCAEARSGADRRILGFISRFEIFRGVPYGLVEGTIAESQILHFADGTVLLRPGQRNDSIAFVLSGRLRVHYDRPDSPSHFIINAGECAGEMSVIDGKPVSAYVVADAGCRVLLVDSDTLFGRLLSIPEVNRNFMRVLTDRVRRTSERMMEQARANLELEQLQRDLRVAHDIQLGMLPPESSFFSERPEVECAAAIRVARQVGGDFYDAFFVDQTHLFLMIGDVCGKGLPAALFMVRAMTLLRSEATLRERGKLHPLRRMMNHVNQLLLERNDASLFVTVFCAILDTVTGTLDFVNAGHCPPLVGRTDGTFSPVVEPRNPVVGIVEGAAFSSGEIVLETGSAIVLYTDGVTESSSPAGADFGLARLLAALDGSERSASALVQSTLSAVESFAGTLPQNDDIAVLAARFIGPKG